jgi:hypothetical protein
MPNYCYNYLTIEAPTAELLQEFWSKAEDGEFSFKHWLPMPESEKGNWYNWCCENWGTKWDTSSNSIESEDDEVMTFKFDTAWSPPREFLINVSKLYPELNFVLSFDETGCDSFGYFEIQDGDIVESVEYDSEDAAYLMDYKDPRTFCFARKLLKQKHNTLHSIAWEGCSGYCEHCEENKESDSESENEESDTE